TAAGGLSSGAPSACRTLTAGRWGPSEPAQPRLVVDDRALRVGRVDDLGVLDDHVGPVIEHEHDRVAALVGESAATDVHPRVRPRPDLRLAADAAPVVRIAAHAVDQLGLAPEAVVAVVVLGDRPDERGAAALEVIPGVGAARGDRVDEAQVVGAVLGREAVAVPVLVPDGIVAVAHGDPLQ